jgi:hypothetical protein
MESIPVTLAFLINWGWLQIGPYIHINIDPVLLRIGPLALHWYGLMYVVAIVVGLWCIRRYTARQGITEQQVYRMLILLANCQKLSSRYLLKRSDQLRKTRGRRRCMFRFC